jgi:hypothetical protein
MVNTLYKRRAKHDGGRALDVSRRGLIGGALAVVPAGTLRAVSSSDPSRPPFHFAREKDGAWRFRSWTWAEGAWRPLTGKVIAVGTELRVSGRPDPRDAAALQAALGRIARASSG